MQELKNSSLFNVKFPSFRCFEEPSVEVSNDVETVTDANVETEDRVDNQVAEKDAAKVNERGVFVPWPKKVTF